jgi:hypothetical protein
MSTMNRASARTRGLRLAARVATVGGLAVAALGLVEARAASAASGPSVAAREGSGTIASDDARPLPMEGLAKDAKSCGCSPCWGPPAPPSKTASRSRRSRRGPRAKRARGGAR